MNSSSSRLVVLAAALLAAGSHATAQEPGSQERVAALKASLAASQVVLRQYEWIETTVVALKGEEKSRQQNRCYYGADGGIQKVPVAAPPAQDSGRQRGVRARVKETAKEELTDYMKQAVALVKEYVPPDSERLQAAYAAGKLTLQPIEPGKRVRLTFGDYLKKGDQLAIDVDITNNRLLGSKVNTYLDAPADAVTLDVTFGVLQDGTSYASAVALNASAKQLTVQVANSGYRRQGS